MKSAMDLDSFRRLIDSSFDYLLVVDDDERVKHISQPLLELCRMEKTEISEMMLKDVITSEALPHFQKAMPRVSARERGVLVYWKYDGTKSPIVFKTGYTESEAGGLYLFRSSLATDVADLSLKADWERIERAKELACLYSVGQWIHDSQDVPEFFTHLPKYLSAGMHYPEHVVVHSVYEGDTYGEMPAGTNLIRCKMRVSDMVCGEIIVGYDQDDLDVLPEEQKLLDEIVRFLCLAIERRSLVNTLELKQEESSEVKSKLRELEDKIARRTREFDEQQTNLKTVNSYLDRVHQGLDESKRTLRSMFQAIPDRVLLIDQNFEIIMTNQGDSEPGAICHKVLFDLDYPCLNCRLTKIRETKAPITVEVREGDTYYEVHALPVYNLAQEVDGIIEFFRDVTNTKIYEQQLQQADKLASLGQLVSGIGHEINNPNQFIRGNIKIVKQALEDLLPIVDTYQAAHPDLKIARLKYDFFREHILVLVNDMSNGSERIKRIVESLKGFARKDEGLLIDKVDINNVIDECARLVHNQVHKSADILLDLGSDLPIFVGNAQKLEQVLINLMINASQAMIADQRGTIRVSSVLDGGYVVVKVADNGCGMSEATAKSIFDPFFTTKRARGGTGLGLSIAFRILEEHEGSISVESTISEGTTFTIRIPIGEQQSARGETVA